MTDKTRVFTEEERYEMAILALQNFFIALDNVERALNYFPGAMPKSSKSVKEFNASLAMLTIGRLNDFKFVDLDSKVK